MTRALAFLLLTACSPQVEVATARVEVPRDPPLDCEGKLPGMFETQDQCALLKAMDEAMGQELDGGPQ